MVAELTRQLNLW